MQAKGKQAGPAGRMVIVTGSYGSGKTEFSANLAVKMKEGEGGRVLLVDLDVVNPYFRSRDVRESFAQKGIDVVAPEGSFSHADLPMLSPRVGGAISDHEATVILDVGGDPAGARVLSRYREDILKRGYALWLVANTRRPDTRTARGVAAMMDGISAIAGLSFTGIVANSHLMEDTDLSVIKEGAEVAAEVSRERNIAFEYVCVSGDLAQKIDPGDIPAPLFVISRYLKKPWEQVAVHQRI